MIAAPRPHSSRVSVPAEATVRRCLGEPTHDARLDVASDLELVNTASDRTASTKLLTLLAWVNVTIKMSPVWTKIGWNF